MFNLKTLVIFVASGCALAAPAVNGNALESRQAMASVYACENLNWNLPCDTFSLTPGACLNVPSNWDNKISSIKNNNKNIYHCVWYDNQNCQGRSYSNQEDAKLNDGNGFFNDRISSWRCNTRQFRLASEPDVEVEA
ncbi:hypothetical protein QBC40DRAFT_302064 [Triangularia verruculosa]|uniref:Uncharacterized protein n=1 Tax=Triangularia verruculosa TaxID=2587418 RepID=A0AAN6X7W2_9PEZI|nr:hypothetical protein QBC40DRAFT_302064 [Triangularia verruculosa]